MQKLQPQVASAPDVSEPESVGIVQSGTVQPAVMGDQNDQSTIAQASIENDVWWGGVNIPMTEPSFEKVRQRAVDYLDQCPHFYVLDLSTTSHTYILYLFLFLWGVTPWQKRHQEARRCRYDFA